MTKTTPDDSPSGHNGVVLCRSFDEYCFVCASPQSPAGLIPIIETQPPWPLEELPGMGVDLSRDSLRYESLVRGDRNGFHESWSALNWRQRCRQIMRGSRHRDVGDLRTRPAAGRIKLLASEGPSAVCGALLGRWLGLPLSVTRDALADAAYSERCASAEPLLIVALREELTDSLLLSLLDRFQAGLDSRLPWESLPRLTLLTARDIAGLSWLVAKIIRSRGRPGPEVVSYRMAHYAPDGDLTVVREREGRATDDSSKGLRVGRETLNSSECAAALTKPADAFIFNVHGFDACARGGGGLVLCGLQSGGARAQEGGGGLLGCGSGHACPRGPHPLPLHQLPSSILMLGTCNGLRLGDSVLAPNFNLGLSFLSGRGLAYVSSMFASLGSNFGSLAFAAALAAGCALGEATALVNGLFHCAGIERTVYVAVGMPDESLGEAPAASHLRRHRELPGRPDSYESEYVADNFCEFLLHDARAVSLAASGQMGMKISSSIPGDNIFWFQRVESHADADQSARPATVRIFVFRFPDSLGRLSFSIINRAELFETANRAFDGLRRWLEIGRLAGVERDEVVSYQALEGGQQDVRLALTASLAHLSFDGSMAEQVERQIDVLHRLMTAARELFLEHILPELPGPFWPTNILTAQYHFDGSRASTCHNCGGRVIRKSLRHVLHREGRVVDVCPRCGIISDLLEGGQIEALTIDAPKIIKAGQSLEVQVRVRTARPGAAPPFIVYPCVSKSGPWSRQSPPSPTPSEGEINPALSDSVRFRFQLPPDHLPHHYYVKVLAVSPHELAFASRVFFIQ